MRGWRGISCRVNAAGLPLPRAFLAACSATGRQIRHQVEKARSADHSSRSRRNDALIGNRAPTWWMRAGTGLSAVPPTKSVAVQHDRGQILREDRVDGVLIRASTAPRSNSHLLSTHRYQLKHASYLVGQRISTSHFLNNASSRFSLFISHFSGLAPRRNLFAMTTSKCRAVPRRPTMELTIDRLRPSRCTVANTSL
jgi:hypothetical protein